MYLSYWCTTVYKNSWPVNLWWVAQVHVEPPSTSKLLRRNTEHLHISSLPLHVLSGCDTVSQMFGIGKGKALKTICNSKYSLEKLGDSNIPFYQVLEEATQFVIACYGSRERNISAARYGIWTTKMANSPYIEGVAANHWGIWTTCSTGSLPSSDLAISGRTSPIHYGWTLDESKQLLRSVPLPDDVSPAPMDVLQLIRCGCSSEMPCMTARCSCYAAHLSCFHVLWLSCRPQLSQGGGGVQGGVLDPESRGKKIPFHSFTMKIKTFHVSRRKTHANSAMKCTCINVY